LICKGSAFFEKKKQDLSVLRALARTCHSPQEHKSLAAQRPGSFSSEKEVLLYFA
jgi:hypothetical protein